ncbi:MAG: ROK family transcriptional regulator [Lachnospiraceae bacterium]|jgi:predicted NBD/HSP70 family sugar kinase|nr:ROK family transcriptional regulator [Lachnospiraceae bacterium]MCH4070039.1 ROK family transcriptional regulator [Lachnospiraceae bacterium]MCH4108609.1 ROK family transcriptional regulator [Lachnospiraceae bacterium]
MTDISNSNDIKHEKRQQIFRCILKEKSTSRQDIAHELHISMPTALQYITELQNRNFIREDGLFRSTGGRKAGRLTIASDTAYFIGADITKGHISYVLTNLAGELVSHERIPLPYQNMPEYYQQFQKKLLEFIGKNKVPKEKISGVGFAIPGILDAACTTILDSHVLGLKNLSVLPFAEGTSCPVLFLNDANAAAVAEMHATEATDKPRDFVYLSLSNSIGGAVFVDGHLYRGTNQRSGEFGHMRIVPGGKKCYCGQRGCLDAYCSALTLSPEGKHLERFFSKLQKKDKTATRQWDMYLKMLSLAIINIRMAYDCPIILGGYVGNFIEPYMPQLCQIVSGMDPFETDSFSYLHACHYQLEASAFGASLAILDSFIDKYV